MIFRQILHPDTGCASYLLGCQSKHAIAIVDSHIEHVQEYLMLAADIGVSVVAIIETHVQADHPSGAAQLADLTGAPIYLHERAVVDFPHREMHHGDRIELGNVSLRVLHTPGHSPDSTSLLACDRTRADDPWFALTGDTLFVGDAGRPDLTESGEDACASASQLYDSLFDTLLSLPDYLEIYPAHFAGSACGRRMSGKPSSTIGFERRFNQTLQPRTRQEFVDFMLENPPPAPERHVEIRSMNRSGLVPTKT